MILVLLHVKNRDATVAKDLLSDGLDTVWNDGFVQFAVYKFTWPWSDPESRIDTKIEYFRYNRHDDARGGR